VIAEEVRAMSATNVQFDFVAKADDLITALEHARENLDAALRLAREIEAAAKSDDCGGLPRLGFAVAGEAKSFAGVLVDDMAPEGFPFDERIGDACNLHSLIELALGREVEAVAS